MGSSNSQPLEEPAPDGSASQLVLRLRNTSRQIQDIRFEFLPDRDSAEGVSNELVAAGLIVREDLEAMVDNLDQLITQPPPSRTLTFRTSTGITLNDIPNERMLIGFAQLSIANPNDPNDPNPIDVYGNAPLD